MDFPLIRVWYCAFGPFRSLRMSEPYYVYIQAILVKNAAFCNYLHRLTFRQQQSGWLCCVRLSVLLLDLLKVTPVIVVLDGNAVAPWFYLPEKVFHVLGKNLGPLISALDRSVNDFLNSVARGKCKKKKKAGVKQSCVETS